MTLKERIIRCLGGVPEKELWAWRDYAEGLEKAVVATRLQTKDCSYIDKHYSELVIVAADNAWVYRCTFEKGLLIRPDAKGVMIYGCVLLKEPFPQVRVVVSL